MTKHLIVIPARLESSRLPRKLLQDIGNGRSVIEQSYRSVMAAVEEITSKIFRVVVATDSEEIKQHLIERGIPDTDIYITSVSCRNGTERAAELLTYDDFKATQSLLLVQGDELYTPAKLIALMWEKHSLVRSRKLRQKSPVITAVVANDHLKTQPSEVLVMLNSTNHIINMQRGGENFHNLFANKIHLGYYIYDREHLELFRSLPDSRFYKEFSVELLKFVEADIQVLALEMPVFNFLNINTQEDLEKIRRKIHG